VTASRPLGRPFVPARPAERRPLEVLVARAAEPEPCEDGRRAGDVRVADAPDMAAEALPGCPFLLLRAGFLR
jgi:hypothetical protein